MTKAVDLDAILLRLRDLIPSSPWRVTADGQRIRAALWLPEAERPVFQCRVPCGMFQEPEQFALHIATRYVQRVLKDDLRIEYDPDNPVRSFVVLGCPRSGTSLLAGVLHHSGVDMGQRFHRLESRHNRAGFYENLDFTDENEALLKRLGIDYLAPLHWSAIPPEWAESVRDRLVGNAFGDWGFKDPRTVLLWPLYRETLADLDPRLLVTQRGPMALMRSWLATGWVESEAQALKLLDYYDDRFIAIKADAVERGWPVLQVVFEDWWDDLNGQRERLSRFLGRDADVSHFDPALGRSGKGRDS